MIATDVNSYALRTNWRDLYRAALFETDRTRIPQRITEAEMAIMARVKELFVIGGDQIDEQQILDDALYALKALRVGSSMETDAA
jgi:hypothetical protein